jgi:quinol monooxygenase YgiN
LLQVWESEEAAEVFFTSDLIKRYADHTDELLHMKNISAGGTWIGKTFRESGRFRS